MDILFVCSANRFRSVIAEGYFRFLCAMRDPKVDLTVGSAGIWAINGLTPVTEAVQFARGRGFSVGSIRSKEINQDLIGNSRLIIVMTSGQREAVVLDFPKADQKTVLLSQICRNQRFDIPDLGENEEESAFELADEICALLDAGFDQICSKVNVDKSP